MSNRAISWAFQTTLPTTQKFVLVALADLADEYDSCYPSQEYIARVVGATDRTVRRALTSLEDDGYIERSRRYRDGGYRSSDRYFLILAR